MLQKRKTALLQNEKIMVLLKEKPSSLQDRQASLSITLSTSSPTLSLSAPSLLPPFSLVLTVHINPGTSRHPDRPITICTTGTVLDPAGPPKDLDIMAQGALGPLRRISNNDGDQPQEPKSISLGLLRPHRARHENPPRDMRECEWLHWLTIPPSSPSRPAGSDSAPATVQVAHPLPLSRIFQHEHHLALHDVTPGERYRIAMSDGYVGTPWWCWGDLTGDLRSQKFSAWQKGWQGRNLGVEKPSAEEMERKGGEWVVGEDVAELWVEGKSDEAVFRFVE